MNDHYKRNRPRRDQRRPIEDRPVLRLPLLPPEEYRRDEDREKVERPERGVAIIDFTIFQL